MLAQAFIIATAIAAAPLIAAATTTAGIAGAANIISPPFSVDVKYGSIVASVDNRGQNAGSAANDSGNYSRTHNITPFKAEFPCRKSASAARFDDRGNNADGTADDRGKNNRRHNITSFLFYVPSKRGLRDQSPPSRMPMIMPRIVSLLIKSPPV